MPAIVTMPPILVATAAMDRSNQNSNFVGAFAGPQLSIGTNRYAALADNVTPGFKVYKSTDSGQTWTLMDDANSPTLASFPLYEVIAAPDGIFFVWNDDQSHGSIHYARFDPSTDTWGPDVESPHNITSTAPRLAIARRSSGEIVVIYDADTVAGNLHWGSFSIGGVWAGEIDFNTSSTALFAVAAIVGPDDTVHVIVQDGAGPFDMFYQTLSPLNVVSAAAAVATLGAGTPNSFLSGFPAVDVDLDQLIFPFSDNAGSPTDTAMFVGQPIAAPVWSTVSLETGLPASAYAFPIAHRVPSGPFWIFQTLGPGGGLMQVWLTPWDGTTLGTPQLVYDAVANPPTGETTQEILKVSVSQFSPFEILVAMELNPDFPPENTYFFRAPMPLAITCDSPPAGKVNIPYSHFFPVTGGTEPYSNFVITEGSLPAGLALNPDTGEVSGTPTTSGTYTFTVEVTDEVDDTADVECSIVIKTCLIGA